MIGLRGELATIAVDFAVGVPTPPYFSIGSGRHNAFGALHALADSGLGGEEKTRKALEAAAVLHEERSPAFRDPLEPAVLASL